MKKINVAAGVIFRRDQKILLGKRGPGRPMEGFWEFPGGKVEKGESPELALERELFEELGIIRGKDYILGGMVDNNVSTRGGVSFQLTLIFAQWTGEEIPSHPVHDEIRWMSLSEAMESGLDIIPSNLDIIKKIAQA